MRWAARLFQFLKYSHFAAHRKACLRLWSLEDRAIPSATVTSHVDSDPTTALAEFGSNPSPDPVGPGPQGPYPEIGDFVWRDLNGNGLQDFGEPGIANVTLQLYQNDKLVGTTTTDAMGRYFFNSWNVTNGTADTADDGMIAGVTYQIRVAGNQPNLIGLRPTIANSGTDDIRDSDMTATATGGTLDFTLGDGAYYVHYDMGYATAATIGNLVWSDKNNNGKKDANEVGLPGVSVRLLDATGAVEVVTTTTAADGSYLFTGLLPGIYVVEIAKSNFASGAALFGCSSSTGAPGWPTGPFEGAGTPDGSVGNGADHGMTTDGVVRCRPVTVMAGTMNNQAIDFGFFRPGTLTGRVYVDVKANGQMDAEDVAGVAGVKVTAAGPAGLFTTTTDAAGNYSFANLPAGTFTITESQPVGYRNSTPNFVNAIVGPAAPTTVSFGQARTTDLSVKMTARPNAVAVGGINTLTYRVKNLGMLDATGVTLLMPLPQGMSIIGVDQTGAAFDQPSQRASIPTLAAGAEAVVVLRVRAHRAGTFRLMATVQGPAEDVMANNRSMVWSVVGTPWSPPAIVMPAKSAFLASAFRR
ncbi:MAG TPA: SdrD B-like domain-containing protein [Gemmataceae bacterium]|jgi:hypothetical protein|nr:SdrD B-like domain-containing protein [Gemmataceae bacterium]